MVASLSLPDLGAAFKAITVAWRQPEPGTLPSDPHALRALLGVSGRPGGEALAAVRLVFTHARADRIVCPWLEGKHRAMTAASAAQSARKTGKPGRNQYASPDASGTHPGRTQSASAAHPRMHASAPPDASPDAPTVHPRMRNGSTSEATPTPQLSARTRKGPGLGGGELSPPLGGGESPRSPTPSGRHPLNAAERPAGVAWPVEPTPDAAGVTGRLFDAVPRAEPARA